MWKLSRVLFACFFAGGFVGNVAAGGAEGFRSCELEVDAFAGAHPDKAGGLKKDFEYAVNWVREAVSINSCSDLSGRYEVLVGDYGHVIARSKITALKAAIRSEDCAELFGAMAVKIDGMVSSLNQMKSDCDERSASEVSGAKYTHVVVVPVARVRGNPVSATSSETLDKLVSGTRLIMLNRYSNAVEGAWGQFGYKQDGLDGFKTGWISMDLVREL